jgi:DNA-binding HxlR family transcriptional regulator
MSHRVETEATRKSYNHPCLIARTLDIIGDRWTLLIVRDLMSGLHRYGDILENCPGMSPNVLSDRLKRLVTDGLVLRDYRKGLPPTVEYTLTEQGWDIRPILLAMIGWARTYLPDDTDPSAESSGSADFVIRTVPTFAFDPRKAANVSASLAVELTDCDGQGPWMFTIADGSLQPRRLVEGTPDVALKTTVDGFLRFIRGKAPVEQCGELCGSVETATAIQACFVEH